MKSKFLVCKTTLLTKSVLIAFIHIKDKDTEKTD